MKKNKKDEIITFKVDYALSEALKGIHNRSEFIRAAIQNALNNTCPLCKGNGFLSPDQVKHWNTFAKNHTVQKCHQCQASHLVCFVSENSSSH